MTKNDEGGESFTILHYQGNVYVVYCIYFQFIPFLFCCVCRTFRNNDISKFLPNKTHTIKLQLIV